MLHASVVVKLREGQPVASAGDQKIPIPNPEVRASLTHPLYRRVPLCAVALAVQRGLVAAFRFRAGATVALLLGDG